MRVVRHMSLSALTLAGAMVTAAWMDSTLAEDLRVALVIGESNYKKAPLRNPTHDAEAIADMFTRAGYKVDFYKDLGYLDFKAALQRFEDEASEAEIAVVYYAGHGIEVNGANYLIPVDAVLVNDRHPEDSAIPMDRAVDAMFEARKLKLVILDACRDNPFKRSERMVTRSAAGPATDSGPKVAGVNPGLAYKIPNTLVAYATAQGATADDDVGNGQHSPFTDALLHHLTIPGLDIRRAFGAVTEEVDKVTKHQQVPAIYASLGGDNISLVPPPPVEPDGKTEYEAAKQVDTIQAWEVFISHYPNGFYSELARVQLEKLRAQEKAAEQARLAEQAREIAEAKELERAKLEEQARRAAEAAKAAEQARLAEQARKAEEAKAAEQARLLAEQARKAEEAKAAEQARLAEQARKAEEAKAAEHARLAEQARKAEEAKAAEHARLLAEQARKAEEAKAAEQARLLAEQARKAEEAKAAEQARLAEQARKAEEAKAAEQARLAEQARKAEEAKAAEQARLLAEQARKAEEAKAAEQTRLAEQARKAEEAKAAEQARLAEQARKAAEQAKEEARAAAQQATLAEQARIKAAERAKAAEDAKAVEQASLSEQTRVKPAEQAVVAEQTRLASLPPGTATSPSNPNTPVLISSAQRELRRLGCFSGDADGMLSRETRAAIKHYYSERGRRDTQQEVTEELLSELKGTKGEICTAGASSASKHAKGEDTKRPQKKEAQETPPHELRVHATPVAQGSSGGVHMNGIGF
jgi:uncharacterized caspase-like protein